MAQTQALNRYIGNVYSYEHDGPRLDKQYIRIWDAMVDGQWRTLGEIEAITDDPQASISARLRDFRKARYGRHMVAKRPRLDRSVGLWEYKLVPNPSSAPRV